MLSETRLFGCSRLVVIITGTQNRIALLRPACIMHVHLCVGYYLASLCDVNDLQNT